MDRQEVGCHRRSVLFINGSTLFADPSWWNRCGGKASRVGVFPSESPHDPQHLGAEG